jgi:hypothetical protein
MAIEDDAEMAAYFDTDVFAVSAVYTTLAGAQSTFPVILDQGQNQHDLGAVGVALSAYRIQARVSDVAQPKENDTVTIGGKIFRVRVPSRDISGQIWMLDCDRLV